MSFRPDRATLVGLGVAVGAMAIYWLSNRFFDAGRGDFFYLADAFLHGRVWLDFRPGPNDVILDGAKVFVPFAPFPAIALAPLVAITGPQVADQWESGINAFLAAVDVGLAWWLLGRLGVKSLVDRGWLVALLGLSTQIWWVTTRGGVWHTGHLIATMLTLACLIELWGKRRGWLIGLMAGAAFLTRAPLALAVPFYALLLAGDAIWEPRTWPWRSWFALAAGVLPSIAFFLWYNDARFGSPFESGYALATLPDWLEARRASGLFAIAHVPVNIDYLFLHPPSPFFCTDVPPGPFPDLCFAGLQIPFFRPDGLGMSILITSPGLLYAWRAPWRESRTWWLVGAAILVLIPTLLYYGGGWLQYGYRYALDSIPFVFVLCGLAAANDARIRESVGLEGPAISAGWRWLIVIGVAVGLAGVYWAYHL
jgi:hypothetical protein